MVWLWIGLGILVLLLLAISIAGHLYVLRYYIPVVVRIFQERPIFKMLFGQPQPDAEEVELKTPDGLTLLGCYLHATAPRKGVVLFALEFASNRWACVPYCSFLREAGYDVFTFEPRGQGKSSVQPGYEPLQWVTDFEVIDFRTALDYLKNRADRHPRGVGLFGLSKGASAALIAAAKDDFVRCFVVDGIFATYATMVPYMAQWVFIYTRVPWIARLIPNWYFAFAARIAVRILERERACHYPLLERHLPMLSPRPLLMIHGGADNYIKPEMARSLFERVREPKELWLVENANHNQAFHQAGEEYKRRVLEFFEKHLALPAPASPKLATENPELTTVTADSAK